ncbi:MAG TPA: cytochrome d ubiquinol oxidase subunit II [Actinomycetes bacterium]|nr:cytochrome d ubiquinol oxidase subunit II [Actinomycetes bacterium]
MTLVGFWFGVLVVFWTGFLVLEGFDFGVGMLHGVVGRDERGRRLAIQTIGPLWDGNEVWLIVAAAGTFAAFPGWYATMFSGFYLAFLLLLVALIARGVSFEFYGKRDSARWRRAWDAATTGGSLLAPLLIGVALGNLLHGVPIGTDQEYAGTFTDLLNGYSLFTGVTVVLLCLLHGASFLTLKTAGELRERAVRVGRRIAPVAAAAVLGFAVWTQVMAGQGVVALLVEVVAVLAAVAAAWLLGRGPDGRAFAATSLAMAAVVVSIFVNLYPRVMVSTLGASNDLTVTNTSSAPYSLKVMTVAAAVLFPIVLAYQGWTYYVFRRRVGGPDDTAAAGTGPVAGRAR